MDQPRSERARIIEALIFASSEPLSAKQIAEILRSGDEAEARLRLREDEILGTIRELNAEYVGMHRSFRIIQVAGGFQFATMPDYAIWLGRLAKETSRRKLTQATIETLSVIAYKQPVTKPELEQIRGVQADYAIQKLMERNLVTIVGRAAGAGRPLLYGTTDEFLKHFGLNDLSELPKPREIEEILADTGFELERELMKRMGKEMPPTDGSEPAEALGTTVVSEQGSLTQASPTAQASPASRDSIADEPTRTPQEGETTFPSGEESTPSS